MSPDSEINAESTPKKSVDAQSQLLTVREVSQRLKVSTATTYKLVDRGELAHVRVSNSIRISEAALSEYRVRFLKWPC